ERVKQRALARLGEAEQLDGILAHLGVNEQANARAGLRQVAERLQRHVHEVTHAADVDDEPIGTLLRERADQAGDHWAATARRSATRSGLSWRWQSARASASAASAGGRRASPRRSVTPRPTASFPAVPWPTAASFTDDGEYSCRATPAEATAASTAPRTSPIRKALCTLRATKARSSTTTDGAQVSISSRHSACNRASRSGSVVVTASTTVPLARYRSSGPALSTTPQPVTRVPGSIPSARTPPPPNSSTGPPRRRGGPHADSFSSSSAAMSMFDDTCCTSS